MHIDFLGGIGKGRSTAFDSQECINFYPEYTGPLAKSKVVLIGTPGKKLFTTVGTGGIVGTVRGMYVSATGRLFVVSADMLYEIDSNKNVVYRGTMETNKGSVSFAENETQLMIVDGIAGYIFYMKEFVGTTTIPSNTFAKITNSNYRVGTNVICKDRYFIQNVSNTQEFIYSAIGDGATWDALDFYTAEGTPDELKSVAKLNNDIWLFGSRTCEIWGDTGDSNSPFIRIGNAFMDIGITALNSLSVFNNIAFWLGSSGQGNPVIWMANSYIPKTVSNSAIEYIISKLDGIEDATSFCYQQEGHIFYQINFTRGNISLVYDATTQLWHQRSFYNANIGVEERDLSECYAFFNNKNYVSDYRNSNIYELDLDTYTDNGDMIRRVRTGPHIHQDRKRIFFHEFELDCERGVGLNDDVQGNKPRAMLQWSNDSGHTWSEEYWGDIGKIGEFMLNIHFHRLGMSRSRVFRLMVSDPVKWVIVDCRIEASVEKG